MPMTDADLDMIQNMADDRPIIGNLIDEVRRLRMVTDARLLRRAADALRAHARLVIKGDPIPCENGFVLTQLAADLDAALAALERDRE